MEPPAVLRWIREDPHITTISTMSLSSAIHEDPAWKALLLSFTIYMDFLCLSIQILFSLSADSAMLFCNVLPGFCLENRHAPGSLTVRIQRRKTMRLLSWKLWLQRRQVVSWSQAISRQDWILNVDPPVDAIWWQVYKMTIIIFLLIGVRDYYYYYYHYCNIIM